MDTTERKKKLRNHIRKAERSLSAGFREISDAAVCEGILSLAEYREAKTVFLFVGVGAEIDTTAVLRHALETGKRLLVPLCTAPGIMEARQITSLQELSPGAYGIPEPGEQTVSVPFEEVDFALIPCYTCDKEGHRLGKGGGYYDRFLEGYGGKSAMVVRECLMNDAIPMEKHDAVVLPVVTDKHIYR